MVKVDNPLCRLSDCNQNSNRQVSKEHRTSFDACFFVMWCRAEVGRSLQLFSPDIVRACKLQGGNRRTRPKQYYFVISDESALYYSTIFTIL